jgi:hypothetical protein
MNKLESKILDNVNKQKKEGSYSMPRTRNVSKLLDDIKDKSNDYKTQD